MLIKTKFICPFATNLKLNSTIYQHKRLMTTMDFVWSSKLCSASKDYRIPQPMFGQVWFHGCK